MLSKIRHALRTDNAFVALLLWPYFYMYFYFTCYYFATKCMNGEIIWFYHVFFVYLLADCSVMFLSMAIPRRWQRIKLMRRKLNVKHRQGGTSHFTLSYGGDMITDLIIAYYFYSMYLVVLMLNKKTFSHYTSTYCITFRLK